MSDTFAGNAAPPTTWASPPERPPPGFGIPTPPPEHRVPARLTAALRAAGHTRLTAVVGPAGSGKTALVSAWARAGMASGPVAWLTLGPDDNTSGAFWRQVLECLRRSVPDLDLSVPASTSLHRSATARLAAGLSARPTPVVLVLDRAEAITDRAIAVDLDLFFRYATPGLRLVLVGRTAHLTPLHRYRLIGDLVEIGAAHLALTADELADVVQAHGVRLTDAEVAAMHRDTHGWLAGVCLHAAAMRRATGPPRYPDPAGSAAVARYLRTEVLAAQPARVRNLLLRTSVLDDVDPDLAESLTGGCDARGILDGLAGMHTFVTQVDADRFCYHRPLRSMLRDVLAVDHPGLAGRLHGAAAAWYAERGATARAVRHAADAGDWDRAARTAVEQVGVARLLTAPEAEPCHAALAGLPDDRSGAEVELVRSTLALIRCDAVRARLAVTRAAAYAGRLTAPSAALALGVAVVQVTLARLAGDLDAAEAAADAAAEVEARSRELPEGGDLDAACARAVVLSNLGVARLWRGRLEQARGTLERAAALVGPGTEYAAHDALGHLALLRMYEGRMHEADKYAQESLAVAERAGIPPGSRSGAASATLAAISLVWNDLPAARGHASRAIRTAGSRHDPATAVTIALLRAWTACARHDGRAGIVATDVARAHLSGQPPQLIADRIELTAHWAHLIVGDTTAARECVARIRDPAEHAVALGYLLEAEGDHAGAHAALSRVSVHDASPSALQYAALALGRLAAAAGDLPAAANALSDALDYGRPERRRRPVSDAGGWARRLLRDNARLAGEHRWLSSTPDAAAGGSAPPPETLTERETDVLRRLSEGLSTRDIAKALYMSVNTVKTHLKSIYRKLGTAGRSATVRRARDLQLLSENDTGSTKPLDTPPAPDV